MMKVYDYKAVDSLVFGKLAPLGYDIHVVPGSLVDGYICISPDDDKYHFLAQERYLNEWSSGVTVRRCRKLPKWAVANIRYRLFGRGCCGRWCDTGSWEAVAA